MVAAHTCRLQKGTAWLLLNQIPGIRIRLPLNVQRIIIWKITTHNRRFPQGTMRQLHLIPGIYPEDAAGNIVRFPSAWLRPRDRYQRGLFSFFRNLSLSSSMIARVTMKRSTARSHFSGCILVHIVESFFFLRYFEGGSLNVHFCSHHLQFFISLSDSRVSSALLSTLFLLLDENPCSHLQCLDWKRLGIFDRYNIALCRDSCEEHLSIWTPRLSNR